MKKFLFLFFLPCPLIADPSPAAEGDGGAPFDEKAAAAPATPKDLPWQQFYNDGREHYYKNDFGRAHQHFSEALRKCPKPEDQEQIFYNLGNTCYRQSQLLKDEDPQKVPVLEQSVQNYRSALSLDKEAKDTQNNLKMAEKELDRVRKKQNDNKDNNDNNDGHGKDNKGNQDNKSSNDNNNNKDNKDNKNSNDNKDNRNDQQGKNDNKDQNQGQQNQGQQNPENKDPQDQKEQNQPQGQSNPQNQPQQQQESPDKNQESPSSSQPQPNNPNPQQQPPKPQAGDQAPQPEQDPKKQEIENILKKAANSERMFPQANQAGATNEPILKDW